MPRMNVLFGCYQAVANPSGGVYTQVMRTRAALQALGVSVTLFDAWRRYDWSTVDLVHIFSTDMRNHYLIGASPGDKPLVVSPIIDNTYPISLLRAFASLSRKLPVQILTSYKSHARAMVKARAIIAPAEFDRPIFEAVGADAAKIEVIHNGVELEFQEATPDLFVERYGLKDFVLFVGQIGNKRKNLPRFLRVAGQMPRATFVLIGPQLETDEARRTLDLAARYDNVRILGRLPYDELISAYAACLVLALPSLVEGTGLVALEAALAGAQVVVTKHGGPPDYFGDLAFYVDPKSEASIRKALASALAQPADGRLRQRIASQFTWEMAARKLRGVYERVLAG